MEQWDSQHCLFVYDNSVRSSESVKATQKLFCAKFNVGQHGSVPSRNTILGWVEHFRSTGNLVDKKNSGPKRSVNTPANVRRVREALIRSTGQSARRQASALQINRESIGRILHKKLKFHPYKKLTEQQHKATDFSAQEDLAYSMQVIFGMDDNVTFDEAHFHLSGTVNKKIDITGLQSIHTSLTSDFYTLKKSQK